MRSPHVDPGSPTTASRLRPVPSMLLATLLFILPLAGSPPAKNPNEVVRLESATAMAFALHFDLGDTIDAYGLSEDVSIRDGRIYSDKAPGLSMLAVPALWIVNPLFERAPNSALPVYWPMRHVLTLLLIALPTVGLAFLVGAMVPAGDSNQRTALFVTAALATPLWTYGTVFFGHALAALLVTAAWLLLLGPPGRVITVGPGRVVLGGVAAGLAVASEYPTALIVAVVFLTLIVRRTSPKILLAAGLGALAGVLPALWYHQVAFGAPWITGYSYKAAADFQSIHAQGVFGISWPTIDALWGVLGSARRGVLYFCPLLLLTPLGLWWMARARGMRDAGPIATAISIYVLFAAGFVDWTAGWCAAARHLVPVIPLALIVALDAAVRLARNRWGAVVVAAMIGASAVTTALTVVLTPFFPPEFAAPLAQLVLPSLYNGAAFPNILSSTFGVGPVAVAVTVGTFVTLAAAWASDRLAQRKPPWLPAVSIATAMTLVAALAWQGSTPGDDLRFMRAEVLRRLGHTVVADRIVEPTPSPAGSNPG